MLSAYLARLMPEDLLISQSAFFDAAWYARASGVKGRRAGARHYLETGWKQGLDPSPVFSTSGYLENNPDVKQIAMCPLLHYMRYGRFEGRNAGLLTDRNTYRAHPLLRGAKRILGERLFARTIRRNRDARILVIAHLFYASAVPEVLTYLQNLRPYHYDLIVTCTAGFGEEEIRRQILAFCPAADIRPMPNRGFDIAPFVEVLRGIDLNRYDVVFKLQTKGTPRRATLAYGAYMKNRDWFVYLFESALGAFWVHRNIDRLRREPQLALIAPKGLVVHDARHKQAYTRERLRRLGLSLPPDYRYVAGTCYVQRADSLRPLQALGLGLESFEPTERNYFSTAHAFERWLTGALPDGLHIAENPVCPLRRAWRRLTSVRKRARSGLRLLEDPHFDLPDNLILRTLEHREIRAWKLLEVPLGSLAVRRGKTVTPLRECAPYRFLEGDEEGYIEYCLSFRREDYPGLSRAEYEAEIRRNCVAHYRETIAAIEDGGYDPRRPVTVLFDGKHDCIADGQHRACYLLFRDGPEARIPVLRLYTRPFAGLRRKGGRA